MPGEKEVPPRGPTRNPAGLRDVNGELGNRRFVGNALWLFGAELVSKLASFVLVVIVARGLGVRDYGYFVFALAFIPLFLMFGQGCIDSIMVRDLSTRREDLERLFVNGLAARAALAAVGLVVAIVLSPFLVGESGPFLAVVIIGAALFLDELSTYLRSVFQAFEQMRYNAIILTVNRVLSTLLAFVVLAAGGGLVAVCATYFLGSLGALVWGWIVLRRVFPPTPFSSFRGDALRQVVRRGLPLGLASAFSMGAFRLDATLLQAWKGPVAGGMYGIAYRFFEPALFLGWSISAAALPRMTREHVRGERPKTLELSITLLLAVYLPLALGAPFAARFVVDKLFSDRYLPAVNAVTWLVGASLFYSLAHLGRVAAISLGQRGRITLISATTLVGNLVANVFVIPRYSFTGAAVVTFFTEVAEAALLGLLLVRNERRLRFSRLAFVPIIAGLSMLFVLVVTGQRGDDAVLVGAPVYVVSLLAAGWVIDVDTMRAFARLLRRQPPEPSLAHSALPDE
ncbi:MAG: hypothetical protein QOH10_447 [Actinomycetota bacterium]|jgi:O-antigen/teichoic acid export membrane protein|nr:hypothetical protein [Actinomycetota bacterium]